MKGSDRDVSTVVLRVFVSRICPLILLTSNRDECNLASLKKLTSACYFQIARETMLIPILVTCEKFFLDCDW